MMPEGREPAVADIKEGNVIDRFTMGNIKVKICDDYCRDKTKIEVDRILKRITKIALDDFRRQSEEEAS